MQTLHLKRQRHKRVLSGHLWAFAGEITEDIKEFKPGDPVALCESRGNLVGRGYVNPHSSIAVRLLTVGDEEWDDELFERRIRSAWEYRQSICSGWESFRLIFAESDGLPGLIVDKYRDHLVLISLTAGIECRLDEIVAALVKIVEPRSIVLRGDNPFRKREGLPERTTQLHGTTPAEIEFRENKLTFTARPFVGQKTGFYLDQRANRHILRGLVEGKRVLDLFSYTGAWGLTALQHGAVESVMVDTSERALEWGKTDAEMNGFSDKTVFVKAKSEDFLKDASESSKTFDVIVLDPPSLIPSRTSIQKGTSAYRNLNRLALRVVKPGGILISCSCSYLMDKNLLSATIGESAYCENCRIRTIRYGGQSPDHPVRPGHPETEYLTCLVMHVSK